MIDVRLTLTTADGAVGVGMLRDKGPLVWTWGTQGEDTAHTVSALFEVMHKGVVIDSAEIDGDEWRAMEDTSPDGDDLIRLLEYRGLCLKDAIAVLLDEYEPEDAGPALAQSKLESQLESAIEALKEIYFLDQSLEGSEWTITDLANGMRNVAETVLIELEVISSK